jgi:hypothetical protein
VCFENAGAARYLLISQSMRQLVINQPPPGNNVKRESTCLSPTSEPHQFMQPALHSRLIYKSLSIRKICTASGNCAGVGHFYFIPLINAQSITSLDHMLVE